MDYRDTVFLFTVLEYIRVLFLIAEKNHLSQKVKLNLCGRFHKNEFLSENQGWVERKRIDVEKDSTVQKNQSSKNADWGEKCLNSFVHCGRSCYFSYFHPYGIFLKELEVHEVYIQSD